jgi:hypothetical protein
MHLDERAQQCAELRQRIDALITDKLYSVEQLAELVHKLQQLLSSPTMAEQSTAELEGFLQQNLDWLLRTMAQLSNEKDAVATSLRTVQQGRRARHSYSEHN